jgi:hypothetical protein
MEAAAAESRFACAVAEKLVCGLSFDLKAQSWNIDSKRSQSRGNAEESKLP